MEAANRPPQSRDHRQGGESSEPSGQSYNGEMPLSLRPYVMPRCGTRQAVVSALWAEEGLKEVESQTLSDHIELRGKQEAIPQEAHVSHGCWEESAGVQR